MNRSQAKNAGEKRTGVFLIAILLFAFVLFVSRLKKYGVSFDEYYFYQFAELNLHAIFAHISGTPFDQIINFYDLKFYGPAYIIPGEFLIEKIQHIYPQLDIYRAWHVLNFATFLSGAWILYVLSKRFVSEYASLFASLIYLTQPLLWGHGVMNPKDTPFMVFFLAAVTVGIIAVDKISDSLKNGVPHENESKNKVNIKRRKSFYLTAVVLIGLIALVFSIDRITSNMISEPAVNQVFTKIESSHAGSIFYPVKLKIDSGASNGIPVSSYVEKSLRIINSFEFYFVAITLLLAAIFLLYTASSATRWVVLAALLLGLTMSIRILGPAAGGLIGLYAILRLGKRCWKFLLIYAVIAVLTMYLSWPRLWLDPINRFIEAFRVMSNFPWPGAVRFQGGEYLATELPWFYLPKLIAIQFTLPMLILALIGVGLVFTNKFRTLKDWRKTLIMVCWFFIPLVLVIVFRPAMYDNFRQFLFVIPPLFIFAAMGFEKLTKLITRRVVLNFVMLLLILPGMIAGIWLDPYEYVYYNALVGWTANIGRNYEADYWNTSFCEAAQYLSQNAQDGSKIAFTDSIVATIFSECAEKKFVIEVERVEESQLSPDYSVVSTRYDDDADYFRTLVPLITIQRGNTPFLLIRNK